MTVVPVQLRCPTCAATAVTNLSWPADRSESHPRIVSFDCPNGCDVDDESIRQVVGASST